MKNTNHCSNDIQEATWRPPPCCGVDLSEIFEPSSSRKDFRKEIEEKSSKTNQKLQEVPISSKD